MCSRRLHDRIEQLPPHFESALSNSRHILNGHRALLGASVMSLEQQKNPLLHELANRKKGFMIMLLLEYFECS